MHMVDDAGMGKKNQWTILEGCIVALAAPFCYRSAEFEEQKVMRRSGYGSFCSRILQNSIWKKKLMVCILLFIKPIFSIFHSSHTCNFIIHIAADISKGHA